MLLMIDNYDSFTYNLVQYLGELGAEVRVYRNDAITLDEVAALRPQDRHFTRAVYAGGSGCVGRADSALRRCDSDPWGVPGPPIDRSRFGGRIVRAARLMHGKTSPIFHDDRTLFHGLGQPFEATRYHSLLIERATLPECLELSAWTAEGEIMGVRHRQFLLEGIQFHPESILTVEGKRLLKNFLDLARGAAG